MTSAMLWCLLLGSVSVTLAAPDFYSAWCPCKLADQCPLPYGSFFDDIALFGEVPPCRKFNFVRCCSSSDIPDGFNLERRPEYLPRPVAAQSSAESHQARLLAEVADDGLRLQDIRQRQDVIDFKAAQEKLKRDIANGIDNPNPPCGCYTSGTCPGRYATKSTGRDIGCLPGYETCCFLDDPWPNYQVTNLTINAPCSIEAACNRFFGRSPYDIAEFGPLEPCYLGQNRCLDYIGEGTGNTPTVIRPPVTQATTTTTRRPTTRRTTTRRATTTQRAFTTTTRPTTRYTTPTTTTETTTSRQPAISYYTTTRPVFTFRPVTSERPTQPTYRTSTQKQPEQPVEPLPSGGGSNNIIDIVTNGAYLPPSYDFGNAADRAEPTNIQFALPF